MPRTASRRSKATPRVKDGRVQRKNYRDVSRGPEIRVETPGPGYQHVITPELLDRFLALVPEWSRSSKGLEAIVLAAGSSRVEGRYRDRTIFITAWEDPVERSVSPEHYASHREIWERLGVPTRPDPEFIVAVPWYDLEDTLDDHFGYKDYELVDGERDGEQLVVDRREIPGTILADLTQLGDEIHIYERCVLMRFDRRTAAAYQLLHVFLHELGHHVDAMKEPRRGKAIRGESYAETWAIRCADLIWDETLALLGR